MSSYQPRSRFLHEALWRGFIHQSTDMEGLDALLHEAEQKQQPIAAYIGFDCTAPSLHVGSLMQIMLLRLWQKHGHKPVVLMGGGTTKVGDPSGKDESRKLLDDAAIARNMEGIRQIFSRFLQFGDGASDAIMVNNDDWLSGLKYIDFLREVGRHFSVNRMLSMDSVKLRIEREQHLSFLEFNYMILQGYDFVELLKRHQCRVQFGGSDQWGNIVMGVELERRLHADSHQPAMPLYGVTTPLLTTASGAKMGKTANGAVWMNEDRLPPYDYWQYWRNSEDADVGRFLRLFTDMEPNEIDALEKSQGAAINDAKKRLATAATALCHGRDAAEKAQTTAAELFEKGTLSADMPQKTITAEALAAQPTLAHLLATLEITTSVGEARRDIEKNRCIKFNDQTAENPNLSPQLWHDAIANGTLKISKGKKQHWLVRLAG